MLHQSKSARTRPRKMFASVQGLTATWNSHTAACKEAPIILGQFKA